ncbi:SGNH/GDSL hydrolase family protein [Pedobacter psychroterrae]|uniref:SGNH/GDSL hydrolase family protein n=1 Tax=Pedobacter psychroterrae TaxID=2530453 RepID=A0A4R0NRH1_9SPHI|nr:SGNH/GDSL hydrolase family protein [Pedobacter psychroterrae]TCD03701.1 SGNH/GDSL hydrolase family protein [Pedobacter psychroterrae]
MYNRRTAVKNIAKTIAGVVAGNILLGTPAIAANDHLGPAAGNDGDLVIINAGIGGNTTKDLLGRVEKDCYLHKAELTILMAGTNDMNSVKYIPLKQYEQNMRELAKGILARKSKLIMMTILPCHEPDLLTRHPAAFYEPEGVAGRRKQVNDVIKKIAADYKAHLIDLEHLFNAIGKISDDKDSLLKNLANSNKRDGIHPTANGYRFIAVSVYDYILDHKIPYHKTVCFGDSITKGDAENYPGYLKALLTS